MKKNVSCESTLIKGKQANFNQHIRGNPHSNPSHRFKELLHPEQFILRGHIFAHLFLI